MAFVGWLSFVGGKFNDVSSPISFQLAYNLNTSDIQLDDMSFENYTGAAISFLRIANGSSYAGTLQNVQLTNLQFSSFTNSTIDIQINADAASVAWIYQLSIVVCLFNGQGGTSYAAVVNACVGFQVLMNTFRSGSSGTYNSITVQSLASHGTVGLSTLVSGGGAMNAIANSGTSVTTVAPV